MTVNFPIQGTAADILKRAMLTVHEEMKITGARLILTVHDELLVESPVASADQVAVRTEDATRTRVDQESEYSRQTHEAFLAWRGGNTRAASEALDKAAKFAADIKEAPEFAQNLIKYAINAATVNHLKSLCDQLEKEIDELNENIPPLRSFTLDRVSPCETTSPTSP